SALAATVQAGPQVLLTWRDNAVTEPGFIVERSAGGGAFAEIGTVPAFAGSGPGVSFLHTLLGQPLDITYSYRVKALNAGGSSSYSNQINIFVPSVPLAPSNLLASAFLQGNNARVTLTWTDNAFNESAYRVWRSTDPNFATGVTIVNLGANATSYTTGNIARGTLWYFRVTALNVSGFGSAETSVTTP
ncbi:MAG TPA: fibronectin type III domain-containing protein, partial [Anaerolineales bacterium]|nr:fibronectin type III domain-containing protein [Anaerolineales bacterium]